MLCASLGTFQTTHSRARRKYFVPWFVKTQPQLCTTHQIPAPSEGHFQVSAPLRKEGPAGQKPISQIPRSGNWICPPPWDLFLLIFYLYPIFSPSSPAPLQDFSGSLRKFSTVLPKFVSYNVTTSPTLQVEFSQHVLLSSPATISVLPVTAPILVLGPYSFPIIYPCLPGPRQSARHIVWPQWFGLGVGISSSWSPQDIRRPLWRLL